MAATLYTNIEVPEPGNVLRFRSAQGTLHDGTWVCVANNSVGEEKVTIRVQVAAPLVVSVTPAQAQVDAGRPVSFNCSVAGGPAVKAPTWYYNAKPLGDILREHIFDQRIRLIEPNVLHIASVHREDIGKLYVIWWMKTRLS